MRHQHSQPRRRFQLRHEHQSDNMLKQAMSRIDVRHLCEHVYKLTKHGDYYFSPVRDDGQNPAFAIREDGQVAIDHGTGEGFNAITLIAKIEGLTLAEARQRRAYYAEIGGAPLDLSSASERSPHQPATAWKTCPPARDWNTLCRGEFGDYVQFAKMRGLEPAALLLAHAMGLFFFLKNHPGTPQICVITDDARHVRQDRRIDGLPLRLKNRDIAKSRTIGAASWPVGAANICDKPVVLLVEGLPDLLAATQVILEENRAYDTAPVAMLGAGQHINVHALPHFVGKHVRIFPDRDEAGLKGATTWMDQIQGVAASVDCFSFDAFPLATQQPMKDLNDFVRWGGMAACRHMIPSTERKEGSNGNA